MSSEPISFVARYGIASALVTLSFLAQRDIALLMDVEQPYLFSFVAVVAIGWYSGRGPAFLAMFVVALAQVFLDSLHNQRMDLGLPSTQSRLQAAWFILEAGLMIWLVEKWRPSSPPSATRVA